MKALGADGLSERTGLVRYANKRWGHVHHDALESSWIRPNDSTQLAYHMPEMRASCH